MTKRMPHLLRADAELNRELVLEAARELFSERGLDVTMREIARQAGVGPATLYRRFPTKQELVDAAFADELQACSAIVATGCADPDPWAGLCSILMRLGDLNARNRGFVEAFVDAFPSSADFAAHRTTMLRALSELCRRAQRAGSLRDDFVIDDLMLVLLAGRGVASVPANVRVASARRFSALAIDGLRAAGGRATLPPVARLAVSRIP